MHRTSSSSKPNANMSQEQHQQYASCPSSPHDVLHLPVIQLLHAAQQQDCLAAGGLEELWAALDCAGGSSNLLRQHCNNLLQAHEASELAWTDILAAAEALHEVCWERLHTGHWASVALVWRDTFTLTTLLAVLAKLAAAAAAAVPATAAASTTRQLPPPITPPGVAHLPAAHTQQQWPLCELLANAMQQLDLAAMMGGPRFRQLLDQFIAALDLLLMQQQQQQQQRHHQQQQQQQLEQPVTDKLGGSDDAAGLAVSSAFEADAAAGADGTCCASPAKRARLTQVAEAAAADDDGPKTAQDEGDEKIAQQLLPPGSLTATSAVVPVLDAPSLEDFLLQVLMAQGGPRPAVVRGAMTGWPALTKWRDLSYLSQVAGRRTVPVELGAHYLQEGWGSSLMTLDQFLQQHITKTHTPAGATAAAKADGSPGPAEKQQQQHTQQQHKQQQHKQQQQQQQQQQPLGYLAQHQLFEQVPALAADIITPDYCALGEQGVSSVNAWFGPAGTVTPLHQDPEHNFLSQVVGHKYVRLFDPCHGSSLYPHPEGLHTNTSLVDVEQPDGQRFPAFLKVPFTDVLLQPGDLLYLPPKWWHYVKSLSTSFSVSFWWS